MIMFPVAQSQIISKDQNNWILVSVLWALLPSPMGDRNCEVLLYVFLSVCYAYDFLIGLC